MLAKDDLIPSLAAIVGERGLLTSPSETAPFLEDWRGRVSGAARAVVLPTTPQEVAAVVGLCRERGIAIVPQGANTGHCVTATPTGDGNAIVLGLKRLNRICSIDRASSAMIVDAGVVLAAIHEAAEGIGR